MTHEFKIGDRVRVVNRRPEDCRDTPTWNPMMDETLGKEGIIADIIKDLESFRVAFSNGATWSYKPSWLVPAETRSETAKPNPPFKPGDRVRVKPLGYIMEHNRFGCPDGMRPLAGEIVTIGRYDPNDNSYSAAGYWWNPECFESVESEHTPELAVPMRSDGSASFETLLGGLFPMPSSPSADKLPLIDPTKLLTTIKLD